MLDDMMPRFDVVERHTTLVRAAPEAVFAAIRTADLASGRLARLLLVLRGVPAAILAPGAGFDELKRRWQRTDGRITRLVDFERQRFRVVAERVPEELVIGLLGQFWTPSGGLCADVGAETFTAGPPAGQALAGWNFTVIPRGETSELRTETRVLCAPDARWKFLLYWSLIRPGSGLIRRAMLAAIRKEAEMGRSSER